MSLARVVRKLLQSMWVCFLDIPSEDIRHMFLLRTQLAPSLQLCLSRQFAKAKFEIELKIQSETGNLQIYLLPKKNTQHTFPLKVIKVLELA